MTDGLAHICSALIHRRFEVALAFLSSPDRLSSWAVGMGTTRVHGDGTVEGKRPSTGKPIWARLDPDYDRGTIHYHLGSDPAALQPRIMIQAVRGEVLELDESCCVVSMIAWRQASMDDRRWQSLGTAHEAEIQQVKRLIEALPA